MRVLIIGCGYTGARVGRALAATGHQVFALSRSASPPRNADSLVRTPPQVEITHLQADITQSLDHIQPDFDWIINTVSSSRGGEAEYRQVYFEGTRRLLDWMRPHPPQKYIYTSSTSVYGQTSGELVDEDSPVSASTPTTAILIETEQLLASSSAPYIILRASGIYGPDRGHLFKQYLRDEATLRGDGSHFINMIHVDDLAGAIVHSLHFSPPSRIYNATDDEPVTQLDFFRWLSARLNKPLPREAPPDSTRKRGLTNKRVSNDRLRCELRYALLYPTFREGYSAEIARLGQSTSSI